MNREKTDNAFVIIHFGNNPKYFELELYFCMMLNKYTSNNIVYMYAQDTPISFVAAIVPYVYKVIGFNDTGITYDVKYKSAYSSFNTLRTCDFIFAYALTQYKKICIIESDLVIMNNIDSIFDLQTPSVVYYGANKEDLNQNNGYKSSQKGATKECKKTSKMNGGVLLISPNINMFQYGVQSIRKIVEEKCKYPNEALFEYIHCDGFYNLPVKYNLSHYNTLKLSQYKMNPNGDDVLVFHFNETDYKHLDIVKEDWLEKNKHDAEIMKKYRVKKIPIEFFKTEEYIPNKEKVEFILENLNDKDTNTINLFYKHFNVKKDYHDTWVELFSVEHNCPYWYNPFTGDNTWKNPGNKKGGYSMKKTMEQRKIKSKTRKHKK